MNKQYYYVVSIVFIILAHFYLYKSDFTQELDYKLYDYSQKFYLRDENLSSSVVIVDIDEYSLSQLGQWPWSRIVLAKLLDGIGRHQPSSIGTDIIFSEKDRTSMNEILSFYRNFLRINLEVSGLNPVLYNNDSFYARSIQKNNTVLSVYLSASHDINNECNLYPQLPLETNKLDLQSSDYILCAIPSLMEKSSHYGFINMSLDKDGIMRRMPLFRSYKGIAIPTLSIAILLAQENNITIAENGSVKILENEVKITDNSEVLLNWYPQKWYKKVSAYDVLTNNVDPKMIKDKFVIIGSSAVSLHDQVTVSGGRVMAGVLSHATVIDNFLNDELFIQPEFFKVLNIILSGLITILLYFLLLKKSNLYMFIVFFIMFVGAIIVDAILINNGIYNSLAYFLLPLSIVFTMINFISLLQTFYERKTFLEDLNKSQKAILDGMVHVASVHDVETGAHIVRTKKYIKHLAEHTIKRGHYKEELTPFQIEAMYVGAPLHDVGKVGISDAILKKPGKLTDLEFEVMKTHPLLGLHIINNIIKDYEENMFFDIAKNIAHYHHERWDGKGYPEGLKENKIPIEARFMALADVYDALMSKRCYKKSFSVEETINIIVEGRGSHFDPILVDMFLEIQGEFERIAKEYADDAHYDKKQKKET